VIPPALQPLYPFAPHIHSTPAGTMHYVDEGDPSHPPILMLHGNPTWSFYYRDLIREFSGTHRVIAPDHLGAGLSDKPAGFSYRLADHIANVESLVKALGLDEITLVVHDWGGAIGMGFAVRNPLRVKRFVVFNTAAFPSRRIPPSIDVCRIPGFGALAIRGLNAFARVALIRAVHHRERLTPDVRAGYLLPYVGKTWGDGWRRRIGHLRFVQDIPLKKSHPSYGVLEDIGDKIGRFSSHPMLIVWGARDFCFDEPFYAEWTKRFPSAEAHYLEDASHYVVEDAGERIVGWMRPFLAGRGS
jgi:haloalkane dehalogenase